MSVGPCPAPPDCDSKRISSARVRFGPKLTDDAAARASRGTCNMPTRQVGGPVGAPLPPLSERETNPAKAEQHHVQVAGSRTAALASVMVKVNSGGYRKRTARRNEELKTGRSFLMRLASSLSEQSASLDRLIVLCRSALKPSMATGRKPRLELRYVARSGWHRTPLVAALRGKRMLPQPLQPVAANGTFPPIADLRPTAG
jgi:hypothetical protein